MFSQMLLLTFLQAEERMETLPAEEDSHEKRPLNNNNNNNTTFV